MYQSQFNHRASHCALVVKWFSNRFWHLVIWCFVTVSWAGKYFILSTPNSQEMRRVKQCWNICKRCPNSSYSYDTFDPFIIFLGHLIDLLHFVLTSHKTCGVAMLQAVWACVSWANWQNWSESTTAVLRQKQKELHFACFSGSWERTLYMPIKMCCSAYFYFF